MEVARKTAKSRGRRPRTGHEREKAADIREWAKSVGHHVNERGRIPAAIVDEYKKAHP
ncbi:Lsr2 family DNA-binding protein [Streptomonospora nanhaiensis]